MGWVIVMNKGLWIARKNHLCCLIKKVSDGHGGDDVEWLRGYCREVLYAYPDEKIEDVINCYTEMVDNLRFYYKNEL